MMLSIPLIPYSEEQQMILQDSTFLQLLQKLGLHLGSSIYQMFPRIPFFWSPDMLFNIATRLGPLKKDKLKFSYDELMVSNPNHNSATAKNIGGPVLPPLSSCFTLSSWLTAVQQSKEIFRATQMNMMIFKPNS
ncbi:protein timeless [Nephila pilipes]|uniref:Protein timeless n=1 Tax=Nephila pilipes TaxID=299642 RepID=A0A8X6TEV8_NEPPI|nr:protein timeless [Nephila pilipes]